MAGKSRKTGTSLRKLTPLKIAVPCRAGAGTETSPPRACFLLLVIFADQFRKADEISHYPGTKDPAGLPGATDPRTM